MLRGVLNLAASQIDAAVGAAMLSGRARSKDDARAEALRHDDRMQRLAEIIAIYDRPEHFADPRGFFPKPRAADPVLRRVRRIRGGDVIDASWTSGSAPHCAAVADRYAGHAPNRTAAARLFIHDGPARPAALLVHGYRCGQFGLEERLWPVEWLFDRGLDVALPVLPFHALRAHPGEAPLFPSSDPRMTVEGFRQAAYDLGALMELFHARGSPAVGIMGMSLGGYSASLLATVEERLAFAVPIIPLASIADLARRSGKLTGSAREQSEQHAALERAHKVVSPLARAARIASDRILVVAAAGDRITPPDHAKWLSDHFKAPLTTFAGGHLLQFGRAEGFRAAGKMLGRLGLLSRR
jgi:dienelactone hydrolase